MLSSTNDGNLEERDHADHLGEGEQIDVSFMSFSKTFGTINHSLLLGQLEVYGSFTTSLKVMQSCLIYSFQKAKLINFRRSSLKKFFGPIVVQYIFKQHFPLISGSNLCNQTDDNTLCAINKKSHEAQLNLEVNLATMCKWFYENHNFSKFRKIKLS